MKKIFTAVILTFSINAVAQVTVALPTEPTFTPTNTVSPNAVTALASESTNRVFIDQSGNNPNFNINQIGSGNVFGTTNEPVMVRGNNVNITSIQQGSTNNILVNLNSTLANSITNLTVKEVGNNNSINAACGAGSSGAGVSLTSCNNANLNWQFSGNNNTLQFRGTGNDINSSVNAKGNFNGIYMDVIGNKHTQTIVLNGDYNLMNITQNSTGANGSSIVIDHTGNNNSFTILQSGTVDNVLNIKSVANGGTFSILQKN